jgi:hypothetical protein
MRNFLIIAMLVVLGTAASAQQGYMTFYGDTINGDTVVNTSSINVPYNGFITFDTDVKGKAVGDTVYIDFQGSNDSWVSYKTISTTTHIQAGTAYTKYQLLANPATYLRYRLTYRAYEVSDTAYFKNQVFIYKR